MLRQSKIAVRRQHAATREGLEAQVLGQRVARSMNAIPFATGQLVKEVTFAAGVDRLVDHGLGRRPQGCLVLRDYGTNVCTGVGEATTQPNDVSQQLRMRSPVACTVDLWMF